MNFRPQTFLLLWICCLSALFAVAVPAGECEPPWTGSTCDQCPEGTHLQHVSGLNGYFDLAEDPDGDPLANPLDLDQYRCVPEETCDALECSQRGECSVEGGVAVCQCDPGYTGQDCESCVAGYERGARGDCVLGGACREDLCSGNGGCVDDGRDLSCACDPGYTGDACEVCAVGYHGEGAVCVLDERCHADTCSGNGDCRVTGGVAECTCEPGWGGESCDVTSEGCPRGFHVAPDGSCVADEICDADTCGGNGECTVDGGQAVCACDRGFRGDDCSLTNPPTQIALTGGETSVAYGERRQLSATTAGIGDYGQDLVWSIAGGPGCLRDAATGECGRTAWGDSVLYEPPAEGSESVPINIDVWPDCCPEKVESILVNVGKETLTQIIPDWLFGPLDNAIEDFMTRRCVGTATVAVARNGVPLYLQSYGVRIGTQSSECSDPPYTDPPVKKNTPIRIASLSKAVTGAVLRKVVGAHLIANGGTGSDYEIETTKLLDPHLGLVSQRVYDVLTGATPPPGPAYAPGPPASCSDANACSGNGNCYGFPNGNNPPAPVCICDQDANGQPLFAGSRCEIDLTHCPDPDNAADDRWQDVTLGHLLNHTAGVYGNRLHLKHHIYPALPEIRGLDSNAELQAADIAPSSVDAATPGSVFLEGPSLAELLQVEANRCLRWDPGSMGSYSNLAFAFQQHVIEHLTHKPLGEWTGAAYEHWDSHLGDLLTDDLGFSQAGLPDAGLYMSQYSVGDHYTQHPAEPWPRDWYDDSFYAFVTDGKRPRCVLGNGECDDWIFDWNFDWVKGGTKIGFQLTDLQAGAYSMVAEARAYLRFMKYFRIGGGVYGKDRGNNWSLRAGHGGSLTGSRSFAQQLGTKAKSAHGCTVATDCCQYNDLFDDLSQSYTPSECQQALQDDAIACWPTEADPAVTTCRQADVYTVPAPDANGRITGDWNIQVTDKNCHLPDNVDIFFAVNQRTDELCAAAGTCGADYKMIDDFVYYGLCQVDWSKLP